MPDFMIHILLILLYIISFFIVPLIISFIGYYIYYRFIKKMKFPPKVSRYKKRSMFRRIYRDFPQQYWLDVYNRKPR